MNKKIEELLLSYPTLKAEVANLKIDLEILREEASKMNREFPIIASMQYDQVPSGKCSVRKTESIVEKIAVGEISLVDQEIFRILDKIKEKERMIAKIDNILDTLKENQRQLIELRYFKGHKVEQVADYLEVTGTTVSRNARKILQRFASIA